MAVEVRNDAELTRMIMPALEKAVDYVVQKIWNENRELVRIMVYEAYQPSIYERTGEFKEAWYTDVKTNGNVVHGEFKYAPDKMNVGWPSTEYGSPQYGRHASALDNFDARPYLAEIIYEGCAGPAFGHGIKDGAWAEKRNVWAELNKKIGKNKIKQLFEEGLRRQGITFSRHKSAIGYSEL